MWACLGNHYVPWKNTVSLEALFVIDFLRPHWLGLTRIYVLAVRKAEKRVAGILVSVEGVGLSTMMEGHILHWLAQNCVLL